MIRSRLGRARIGVLVLFTPCACAAHEPQTGSCDAAAAPPPEQPAIPGAIAVTVHRLVPGCDTVLVSSGVPLAPGALKTDDLSQIRLFVAGKEQALYTEALHGTHSDGSLRSVLVEFNYPLNYGTALAAQLVLGQARGTTDMTKPAASRATPAAVVLPSDPAYLIRTRIVGPTVSSAAASALSPNTQRYETDFKKYADRHWSSGGAKWEENYYDRAQIYYAWWVRTGDVEYWKRATAIAVNYQKDYLEARNYATSAHWSQIEGVELHYLLTGDDASRHAVGRVGDVFNVPYYMDNLDNLDAVMDNRIQARTLMAFLASWRINAPSQKGSVWATLLPQALTDIVASQDAGGAYRFRLPNIQCGYNVPFMVGLLNDAMIQYYSTFKADARIPSAVQKSVDYMWTKDWVSAEQSFLYIDGPCPQADGNGQTAPDLNNLIVNGYAWIYERTGDATYRDRADQVFAGAVAKAWLDGSKQFNQQYTSSYRYLAYRQ